MHGEQGTWGNTASPQTSHNTAASPSGCRSDLLELKLKTRTDSPRCFQGWGSALRGAFRGSPNPPVEPKHPASQLSVTPPCSPWFLFTTRSQARWRARRRHGVKSAGRECRKPRNSPQYRGISLRLPFQFLSSRSSCSSRLKKSPYLKDQCPSVFISGSSSSLPHSIRVHPCSSVVKKCLKTLLN